MSKPSTARVALATTGLIGLLTIAGQIDSARAARSAAQSQTICETRAYQEQADRQRRLDVIMPPAKYFNAKVYAEATRASEAMFQQSIGACSHE